MIVSLSQLKFNQTHTLWMKPFLIGIQWISDYFSICWHNNKHWDSSATLSFIVYAWVLALNVNESCKKFFLPWMTSRNCHCDHKIKYVGRVSIDARRIRFNRLSEMANQFVCVRISWITFSFFFSLQCWLQISHDQSDGQGVDTAKADGSANFWKNR